LMAWLYGPIAAGALEVETTVACVILSAVNVWVNGSKFAQLP
jgi:hypothetical protein